MNIGLLILFIYLFTVTLSLCFSRKEYSLEYRRTNRMPSTGEFMESIFVSIIPIFNIFYTCSSYLYERNLNRPLGEISLFTRFLQHVFVKR